MMKAVAAALVLIAGAAVVLWYGNTLNSWVLGGLIGGLAALLLSIPISLTLFSFLSRRHDERLKAAVQEEVSLAQFYDYPDALPRPAQDVYDVESYMLPEDEEWDVEEDEYYSARPARHLPAPAYPRLPVAHRGALPRRLPATQRGAYLQASDTTRQPSRNVPLQGKEASGRRTTSRRMEYPGFAGYQPGASRSQHRSAALRAARMEAAQQHQFDDVEELPTYTSRRMRSVRPDPSLIEPQDQTLERRSSRQFPQQGAQDNIRNYPRRPRRSVDASPSQNGVHHSLPAEGESTASRSSRRPQTDDLNMLYPQTGPMRYSQTDKIAPQSQWDEETHDPSTGNIQRPLLRRAPYMYEDDPLRQELSQHIDPPIVRRSSRYLLRQNDEAE
ncbi:MAG TPA: hypothetical protein VFB12_13625 [Ktedonobacteraceae bacterium]|nr:hypothetical protein [Ktedonobacteraceae bacterium]